MSEKLLNTGFKREVAKLPGAQRVMSCYLCGTCTAGCPVAEVDAGFNPRGIIQKVLLGFEDELLHSADLWKCVQCHNCVAHCPQDARLADVIRALRGLAVSRGIVTEEFAARVQNIDAQYQLERLDSINRAMEQYGR
ncbi:MAG: 4Fe-4S dicluster domain-containing protein [Clostridia bacterium]|nr:4Fe-4S dicluster domain-containing protein [Clostridia bacterium]